jgi:hypothetical protein
LCFVIKVYSIFSPKRLNRIVKKGLAIFGRAFFVVHDRLDEFVVVDVSGRVFLVANESFDLDRSQLLAEVGKNVAQFSGARWVIWDQGREQKLF